MPKVIKWEGGGAAGVAFFCPACQAVHAVRTSTGGWGFNDSIEKPTLSPNIRTTEGKTVCNATVTDGKISYGADSTHEEKGKTLDLPEWAFQYTPPVNEPEAV